MGRAPRQRARRADAERNREVILEIAAHCLAEDPRMSTSEIAQAAGVGRVTLYSHFASRSELVEAVFARSMQRAESGLQEVNVDGEPWQALERLVAASWRIVGESRLILQAAENELGQDKVRKLHEDPLARIRQLVVHGRDCGAFRKDLPADWLVACFYTVLHTAAEQVRSGYLPERDADEVVWTTIQSLFHQEQG